MKARESVRTSTLRLIQSELKNERISRGADLSEDQEQAVLRRAAKQRRESIDEYTKANRLDLAEKERAELEIVEAYLPNMLSEAETEALVKKAIEETGARSKSDRGRVIGSIMSRHKAEVDGKLVNEIVSRTLD